MPKKQPGVAVRVLVVMPRAGEIEQTISVDPADLGFTTPPKADQVHAVARAAVLDQLEVKTSASATLQFSRGRASIEIKLDNETTYECISAEARQFMLDTLKVRVLNAREAIAEIKAFQASQI
jgi:hypothetical protein